MNVKVFGGSGFLGQHLLKSIPDARGISLRNAAWQELASDATVYINLVGKAHDHNRKATEKDYFTVNLDLIKELYYEFIGSSASLFIHVSSIAAMEEIGSSSPLVESDACRPSSSYGRSKLAGDSWLLDQTLPPGKKLIILRPPMVHGEGDKGNLKLLYNLLSKGLPYPLSSFKNKRSFISIANFCFLINETIKKQAQIPSGVYHIADDEQIATTEIIQLIKEVTGKRVTGFTFPQFFIRAVARIGDFIPLPLNTIRLNKMTSDLTVSNKKIKNALHLNKLPVTAVEGLRTTIKSFLKKSDYTDARR